MSPTGQAALLVEGDIVDAARLGRCEIVLAGITAISGDLPRRHVATQIAGHQAHQRPLPIQLLRDRLQLAADLVPGKDLEYSGLDGAFLTHCRLWR
jgi:hypothetical protein